MDQTLKDVIPLAVAAFAVAVAVAGRLALAGLWLAGRLARLGAGDPDPDEDADEDVDDDDVWKDWEEVGGESWTRC